MAVEIISQFMGKPVYPDPPTREGAFSFQSTYEKWKQLTVNGKYTLNKDERSKANEQAGSSFNEPIFSFPCKKQNCGIMHDPVGHITHFMNKIAAQICEKMKGCDWQLRMNTIDDEGKAKIVEVKTAKKSSAYLGPCDAIDKQIRKLRKGRKECLTRALSERNVELSSQLREQARLLAIEEERATDAKKEQMSVTEVGDYNLIIGGLNEFQEVLNSRKTLQGKRPQSALEYAFWKSVEARAGGKLDTKNSGKEQTNRKGMNCMKNFTKIADALLGMYPPHHEVHQWLV